MCVCSRLNRSVLPLFLNVGRLTSAFGVPVVATAAPLSRSDLCDRGSKCLLCVES